MPAHVTAMAYMGDLFQNKLSDRVKYTDHRGKPLQIFLWSHVADTAHMGNPLQNISYHLTATYHMGNPLQNKLTTYVVTKFHRSNQLQNFLSAHVEYTAQMDHPFQNNWYPM